MSTETQTPNLYPEGGSIHFLMPSTNAIGKLKDAEKGRDLTISYRTKDEWIAVKGKAERYFFLGFKPATNDKGDVYYLAKLSNGEKTFVCAQTILIQALMSISLGQGVEITCTGSTKANGGIIPTFEVAELPGVTMFPETNE